jgi:hypothetical protein
VPWAGWQLEAQLHHMRAAHAKLAHTVCWHAQIDQQRSQHPHLFQASQRRPSSWQGAIQLVVGKVPAFRRQGAQSTGWGSSTATAVAWVRVRQ